MLLNFLANSLVYALRAAFETL
nr:hypothetical protein [Tanacetum cinerariifolium]